MSDLSQQRGDLVVCAVIGLVWGLVVLYMTWPAETILPPPIFALILLIVGMLTNTLDAQQHLMHMIHMHENSVRVF